MKIKHVDLLNHLVKGNISLLKLINFIASRYYHINVSFLSWDSSLFSDCLSSLSRPSIFLWCWPVSASPGWVLELLNKQMENSRRTRDTTFILLAEIISHLHCEGAEVNCLTLLFFSKFTYVKKLMVFMNNTDNSQNRLSVGLT